MIYNKKYVFGLHLYFRHKTLKTWNFLNDKDSRGEKENLLLFMTSPFQAHQS